jgi:hypothetical protein
VDEDGRIFIETLRAIGEGEELNYDYAYARDATLDEDESLYPCRCGSAHCRGTLLEARTDHPKATHHVAARQPHEHRKKPASGKRKGSGGRTTAGQRGA